MYLLKKLLEHLHVKLTFFHPNYLCPTKTSELRYRHLYIIQKFQDT